VLALVLALAAADPEPKPVPAEVAAEMKDWADLGIKATLTSTHCGMDNAFYFPGLNTVVLCDELFDRPDLARFVLNHEMGHAAMTQLGIGDVDGEAGADELAFWMSDQAAVFAGASWFLGMVDGSPHDPEDPHPSPLDRAASLLCLSDGTDPHPVVRHCAVYARSSYMHWVRILTMP
jgi:hypothetical protein